MARTWPSKVFSSGRRSACSSLVQTGCLTHCCERPAQKSRHGCIQWRHRGSNVGTVHIGNL
eukprot:6344039-Alexandrium_andersonii.AAC.1